MNSKLRTSTGCTQIQFENLFERLKNGGSKLLVGDLVQPDENDNKTVIVVNEENQHQFTLWDIVMTLPGYDVEYSGMVCS